MPNEIAERARDELIKFGQTVAQKIMSLVSTQIFQKLHSQNIKNIKSEVFPMALRDLEFSPTISEKSRIMALNRHKKLKQSMDIHMRDSAVAQSISDTKKTPTKPDILKYQQDLVKQRIESQKYQRDKSEERQCTFRPQINANSIKILQHSCHSPNKLTNDLKKAYEREFGKGDSGRKRGVYDAAVRKAKEEEDERKECTFQPKIKQFDKNIIREVDSYPRNFEKSVGRARYAFDEKIKKEQRLNYVNRGEFLEFRRSLPMNPPRCAEDYIVRTTEPFVYLNINVRNGKKGLLGLRTDDIPEAKAEEFATEFQLEPDEQRQLEELIKEYIKEELAAK